MCLREFIHSKVTKKYSLYAVNLIYLFNMCVDNENVYLNSGSIGKKMLFGVDAE